MNTREKILLTVFFILFFQLFSSGIVGAKEYPEKTIQLFVGNPPGGSVDLSARVLSRGLTKYLGVAVAVVNMPGGSGAVALNEVAKSYPDGYTIGTLTVSFKGLTIHQQKVPFDVNLLKPIAGVWEFRQMLFVRSDSPLTNLEELIAYGRRNPGVITYGTPGAAGSTALQCNLFFRSAGIKAVQVPYKGAAEYIQAVLGGHIKSAVVDFAGIREHLRAGTLKVIVVFTNQRLKELPEVPTTVEKGFVDIDVLNPFYSIVVHRDTPADRVKKLHGALKKVTEDPEFTKTLEDMGLKGGYTPPEVVEEKISRSKTLVIPILKELNLFIE